ncbi:Serine/threonine-protein kinase StkP [Maioricimonas rarisocia]|uniref:Serine/threonine-protein kinase StkP n=1 Tax=Maioricimonas rarisocia TaxID=2528026 RepID=A0A517Z2Y6_9PLAN|nr:serine/threonine-protein kinase [Maioricimonas rarisocia]QDU36862.1 Serine/threonine-protein kinase StkP [Maioricimonas rarisocia]
MKDDSFILEPTLPYGTPTRTFADVNAETARTAERYKEIVSQSEVSWDVSYRLVKKLGSGGQGVVFLADRGGAFGVTFRLALKFFRPDGYPDIEVYREDMARLARVAMHLARIQQDHLLDVYNVVEYDGIQVLAMEWVDGFDLRCLLTPGILERVKANVDRDRWEYVNDVIVTRTPVQLRLKPGVAIAILRECLEGLGALHREGLVHGDLKPANIMVKRTGNCKIIDFGSALNLDEPPSRPTWTPRYAAVEVLEGGRQTQASDLASLGYILFEMLSGQFPFTDCEDGVEMVAAKHELPDRLEELLPPEVAANDTLINLLRGLIAPDPAERFVNAEQADLADGGATEFQRQLVKGDLAAEYANEIRHWLSELD